MGAYESKVGQLITRDGAIDVVAVRRAVFNLYAEKLPFIHRYTGEPFQFWRRSIRVGLRKAVEFEAAQQQHKFISARMPRSTPLTEAEAARVKELEWTDDLTVSTDMSFLEAREAAKLELYVIRNRARVRAYEAIRAQIPEARP